MGQLNFFRTYVGNFGHVIGGVGLAGLGDASGFATGTINITGVPDTADIAAAFLYWSTMETSTNFTEPSDGKFRGIDIVGKQIAPPNVPSCRGAGGGSGTTSGSGYLHVYFSDVLRYLPTSTDPATLGKVLPNTSYTVSLPDSGGGGSQSTGSTNQLFRTSGASLLIVYRDKTTRPFSAEVIYHGGQTQDPEHTLWSLQLKGFYQAMATSAATVSFMVADGDQSKTETLVLEGGGSTLNPFQSTAGPGWDSPTFPVTTTLNQSDIDIEVTQPTSMDCLSYVGVAANVPVVDADRDGLIDDLETASAENQKFDPAGRELPRLGDMGALAGVPDIFFEFAYLNAPAGLSYGIDDTDLSTPPRITTDQPHSHRPTKNALNLLARAFKNAGITPHFDIGCNYQPATNPLDVDPECAYSTTPPPSPTSALCTTPSTWTPDCAFIPVALAKGGKHAPEYSPWCGLLVTNPDGCQFKDYPGTIGWKAGFQYYRDDVFQFDPLRLNSFHFVFSAHFLGLPRSDDPTSPLYRVPRTNSGMGDVGGGDILQTTAAFGNNFTGQDPVVAGTIAHEAGHNLELRHAGLVSGPPCKPNYQSVMNYAYQFGLNGPTGVGIDFSGQVVGGLDETNLNDVPLPVLSGGTALRYYPSWYAPKATSFLHSALDTSATTRHCDGTPRDLSVEPEMVRVNGITTTGAIDWLNDGDTTDILQNIDVNYNGGPNLATKPTDGPFAGFNDWIPIKQFGLQQLGSRPNMWKFSLDVTFADLDPADPGRLEPGRLEPGAGDPGRLEPGRLEPGRLEPGRLEPGRLEPGAPPGDIDLTTAASANGGPHSLTTSVNVTLKAVVLSWQPPLAIPEGSRVTGYLIFKVLGTSVTLANFDKTAKSPIARTSGTTLTYNDLKVSPGKTYTYFVQAEIDNNRRTGLSNFATQQY